MERSMNKQERLTLKNAFDGNLVHGVRAFHASTGRTQHLSDKQESLRQWSDPSTGRLRPEWTVHRRCPLCGGDDAVTMFVKDAFPHVRCRGCEMAYVNPILKAEALERLYTEEQSYNAVLASEAQDSLDRIKFSYYCTLLEERLPDRGRILDVGCGAGLFLEIAAQRGWDVLACEPNRACRSRLEEKGIPHVGQGLEDVAVEPESLDCVTMWTVLEHVPDPAGYLKRACGLLREGGLLCILVPNLDALANRILHEKSTTFCGDSHINFFNRATLGRMLEQAGCEIVDAETQLTTLGIINNHLGYEPLHSGHGAPVLDVLTPEYIHDNFLGYVLMTIGKKTHASK